MVIINLNGRKSNSKQNTSPQSYKTQINILPFPGLAQTGTEQLGQGVTLLGWPKSIYYAKPSNKMFIIPQQKKNCYFAIGFYFFVRVFRNTLIPSVKMTLTMNKMFADMICQTIEREIDFSTAKQLLFWLLCECELQLQNFAYIKIALVAV